MIHLPLKVCDKDHGGKGNAATVYGHLASVRNCIRLQGTDTWVYDPRWEEIGPPADHDFQPPAPGLTDEKGQPLDPQECGECGQHH